ncbi:SEL1-like repeat protein [Pseudomonas syringae]|uniref:SEL1-like repeat protein n=1 Tax=Pseudomonas syringae TaxID=317 RepID=UPI000B3EF753|nr:SEL1-like repeat protein [Pseudomonas syringae]
MNFPLASSWFIQKQYTSEHQHVTTLLVAGPVEDCFAVSGYRKAFRWYRKAARAGDTAAFARLGKSYLEGNGVSRHVSKGLFWLQRAALNGDAAAADALEYFYEDALYMPDPQGRMRLFWASYAEDLREPFESPSR